MYKVTTQLSFKQQLQNNLLAVISLVIALSALGYNSWRNEQSEENRNFRGAGFEIMREAANLQLLIDTSTYSEIPAETDAIRGWVSVNLIVSLADIMTPEVKRKAIHLKSVWSQNWAFLYNDKKVNEKISIANSQLVETVRQQLINLN